MSIPVVTPAAAQLRRVPPVAWFALAAAVSLAVLLWHGYFCDPEDTDWLDPGQPPINLEVDRNSSSVLPAFRPIKPYKYNSLSEHPGCWVGDC